MAKVKKIKGPPLENGLKEALVALDNQVARSMQRTPDQIAEAGVQKWGPYSDRIEEVISIVLDMLGKKEIELDSLIIASQAFPKALSMVVDELGSDGLGKMRTAYCAEAFKFIESEAHSVKVALFGDTLTN